MRPLYLLLVLLLSLKAYSQTANASVRIQNNPEMKDEFYEVIKESTLDLDKVKGFILHTVKLNVSGKKKLEKRVKKNFPGYWETTPFKGFVINPEQPYIEEGYVYMMIDAVELNSQNVTITITVKDKDYRTLYSVRTRNTSLKDMLAKMGLTTY